MTRSDVRFKTNDKFPASINQYLLMQLLSYLNIYPSELCQFLYQYLIIYCQYIILIF